MDTRILLLGGTGFIGSHIGNSLLENGFSVTFAQRSIPENTNVANRKARFVELDFSNREDMKEVFIGHDVMVNCISDVNIRKSQEELNETHIALSKIIYESALSAGIKKYILLSSVEVYGFDTASYISEETIPRPSYDFQKSLYEKETFFESWIIKNNLSGIILQPASTIGPNEKGSSFFYPLYREHKKGSYPLLRKGAAKVSLVDTRDIGRAVSFIVANELIKKSSENLDRFVLKGYDTDWNHLYETVSLIRGEVSKSWDFPINALKFIAWLLEFFTPKSKELLVSRFGVDLITKNILINDQKLRKTRFSTKYTLEDSVDSAIKDFEKSESESSLFIWSKKGRYVNIKGNKIFLVENLNHGKPYLVFFHGFPTSSYDYSKVWNSLSENFNLVAFDFLGFGFSDKPRKEAYSILEQVDLVEELFHKLGIKSTFLLAHNYGSIVAQELLHRLEHKTIEIRLEKVVFLNGAIFPYLHKPTTIQKLSASRISKLILPFYGFTNFKKAMNSIFGADTKLDEKELKEHWVLFSRGEGIRNTKALLNYMKERKIYGKGWVEATIRFKEKYFINGTSDPVSGMHVLEEYRTLCPNSPYKALENIGHYPQLEDPKSVAELILEFCKKV